MSGANICTICGEEIYYQVGFPAGRYAHKHTGEQQCGTGDGALATRPTEAVIQGPHWDTAQMTAEFDVRGFDAPYVHVTRKADGRRGVLEFTHSPRVYFNWQATE